MNRCEAMEALISSRECQELLEHAAAGLQEYQSTQQDYRNLPESATPKIQRMQANNYQLDVAVFDLQREVDAEKEREERIEKSLATCEEAIERLMQKKAGLEREVSALKQQVAERTEAKRALLRKLERVGELTREERQLMDEEQFDELVLRLSQEIKSLSLQHSVVLVELAERHLLAQQLRSQHESAQRLFSSYSRCESEHDLIAEEAALAQQLADTAASIARER